MSEHVDDLETGRGERLRSHSCCCRCDGNGVRRKLSGPGEIVRRCRVLENLRIQLDGDRCPLRRLLENMGLNRQMKLEQEIDLISMSHGCHSFLKND